MKIQDASRIIAPPVVPPRHGLRPLAGLALAAHGLLVAFGLAAAARGELDPALYLPLLAVTIAGSALGVMGLAGWPFPIAPKRGCHGWHAALPEADCPMASDPMASDPMAGDPMAGDRRAAELTDTLTDLRNRRGFEAAVARALRGGRSGTLALIGGDGFRQVNDRLGHAEGDRLLRCLGGRIAASIRPGDVAGRWGGDEFAVFFPGLDPKAADAIVDGLRAMLVARPDASIDGAPVAFSYGLAVLDRRGKGALAGAMDDAGERLRAMKGRSRPA